MSTLAHPRQPRARQPLKTQLPIEVWVLVMCQMVNYEDFPHAWTNCRIVSRAFKRATELAFMSEALPQIEVNLSLIGSMGRNYKELARLRFREFSEDGQRAHYGAPRQDQEPSSREKSIATTSVEPERWMSSSERVINPPMLIEWASKIYISVCRGPTSYYSCEVSFLWRPMLTTFFHKLGFPSLPKQAERSSTETLTTDESTEDTETNDTVEASTVESEGIARSRRPSLVEVVEVSA